MAELPYEQLLRLDDCRAVGGVVRTGDYNVCLILTGKVIFSLPINYTLGISLPRICKSLPVPLVCRVRFLLATIYFH